MAVKEIKDIGASVLSRLKKQAKETGINYQTCLQLFAQEEFLRKLEMSRYTENLVLKGGMFLYSISNYEGRPTMDIDFMLRRMSNDVAGMEAIMKEICQTDTHNDFITMEVLGTIDSMEQIRAFDQNVFLQKLWNNYNPGSGLEKPDFSSVLVQIDRFIGPVYGALLREDEFFSKWSSKENVWK